MNNSIYNKVEDKIIFTGNDDQLVSFMQVIVKENEDYDFSILDISDAIEYIEDHCSNLELIEQLYAIRDREAGNVIKNNSQVAKSVDANG